MSCNHLTQRESETLPSLTLKMTHPELFSKIQSVAFDARAQVHCGHQTVLHGFVREHRLMIFTRLDSVRRLCTHTLGTLVTSIQYSSPSHWRLGPATGRPNQSALCSAKGSMVRPSLLAKRVRKYGYFPRSTRSARPGYVLKLRRNKLSFFPDET